MDDRRAPDCQRNYQADQDGDAPEEPRVILNQAQHRCVTFPGSEIERTDPEGEREQLNGDCHPHDIARNLQFFEMILFPGHQSQNQDHQRNPGHDESADGCYYNRARIPERTGLEDHHHETMIDAHRQRKGNSYIAQHPLAVAVNPLHPYPRISQAYQEEDGLEPRPAPERGSDSDFGVDDIEPLRKSQMGNEKQKPEGNAQRGYNGRDLTG